MTNFIIELSITHLTLIATYWLFMKKERQYSYQRFYLLSAALFSIVLPLLKLPKLYSSTLESVEPALITVEPIEVLTASPVVEHSNSMNQLLIIAYVLVTSILAIRMIYNMIYLLRLRMHSRSESLQGHLVRRIQHPKGIFTFFNWIFVGNDVEEGDHVHNAILKHEQAHVKLGHSYDLILLEMYNTFFWWLPSSWFVQKEIKTIHEYQADAHVLKYYDVDNYSSLLISSTLSSHGLSLANSFHDGLILKRLHAMKHQSKKVSPWKLGLFTSICLVLTLTMACTEDKLNAQDSSSSTQEREIFTVVEQQPTFPGGMDQFYNSLKKEIRYPEMARKKGIEGRVYLQFNIERNGSISNIQVAKGIGAGCDEEARRTLSTLPSFKAGSQRGRTVRTNMTLPITFRLDKSEVNPDDTPKGSIAIGELSLNEQLLQLDVKYNDGFWQGSIKDNDGNPLPGANIVVEGTEYGRVSGLDGTFSVEATKDQNIVISFIGYESIKLTNQN